MNAIDIHTDLAIAMRGVTKIFGDDPQHALSLAPFVFAVASASPRHGLTRRRRWKGRPTFGEVRELARAIEHTPQRWTPERLWEARPDYVLILPWNLKTEIMEQLAGIREWGGQFVIPIPEVTVYP